MMLRALIASLVFHLLLVFGVRGEYLPFMHDQPATAAALSAVLASPANPPGRDQSPLRGRTQPGPRKMRPAIMSSTPQLVTNELAALRVPVLPQNEPSTAVVADSVVPRTGEGSIGFPKTSSQEVLQETRRVDGLRQYRLAIAREARRYKRYPAVARERGWEGVVTVSLSVPPAGAVPVVSVDKSSGYELLDSQALEMIGSAARAAPLPEALRGMAFSLTLPVRYTLDDN